MAKKEKQNGNGKELSLKPLIKQVDLDFVFPSGQQIAYSNFATAQHDTNDGNLHLTFFQIQQPVVLGTHDEKLQKMDDIKSVPAVCIHKIAISQATAAGLIRAIGEQLAKATIYQTMKKVDVPPQNTGDSQ